MLYEVITDVFDVPIERIRIVQGDSDRVGVATGTGGSRETTVTGTAFVHCAQAIVEKGRLIAGHRLEAPAADIVFEVNEAGGAFVIVGTDRHMTIVV